MLDVTADLKKVFLHFCEDKVRHLIISQQGLTDGTKNIFLTVEGLSKTLKTMFGHSCKQAEVQGWITKYGDSRNSTIEWEGFRAAAIDRLQHDDYLPTISPRYESFFLLQLRDIVKSVSWNVTVRPPGELP